MGCPWSKEMVVVTVVKKLNKCFSMNEKQIKTYTKTFR